MRELGLGDAQRHPPRRTTRTSGRLEKLTAIADTVVSVPGDTQANLRKAVFWRAMELGGIPPRESTAIQPPLAHFVDKVIRHAYRVTDADVESLKTAGYSEDSILEIIISAAVGAGMARLEHGLGALQALKEE